MKFKKYIRESIEDMHKRCENCNTLLNELGTCPKCDKGEEDYGDELEEALTNSEKLKRAFPELNFDDTVEESVVAEELSNLEKLKQAYPELNFDTPLTEGTGADTAHIVKDAMTTIAKDDKNKWANTVSEVIDVIPDDFADELFDKVKETFSNIKLNSSDKTKVLDAAGLEDSEEDTLGKILDAIDTSDTIEKNASFIKSLISVVLGIIAVIEPTPVLEVVTAIVVALPADVIAKIISLLQSLNPVVASASIIKKIRDAKNESLKSVTTKHVQEDINNIIDDNEFDYDDDYDIEDVEEDRVHAALYGGNRI